MSLTAERTMKLMAYADGELEGADLAEVEAWLESDADAVRFVNDLAVLGDYITTGKPVVSVDLTDAIMTKVAATPAPTNVVPIASARRARTFALVGGVAAALAIAASVFVFTRTKDEEPLAGGSLPTASAPAPAGTGVDVDLHETPGQSVGVFYNETNATQTSVTVWVDETGAK